MEFLHTLKLFLISTGVFFTAVGVHVSVPHIINFVVTHVSLTCNFILLCFKPPYIFFLFYAIISLIASTWFHNSNNHSPSKEDPPVQEDEMWSTWFFHSHHHESPPCAPAYVANPLVEEFEENGTESTWTLPVRKETPSAPPLDIVWKTITEVPVPEMVLKKSETLLHERMERDPFECSVDRAELNRRVEAFIMKFREEMRLQKQESLTESEYEVEEIMEVYFD